MKSARPRRSTSRTARRHAGRQRRDGVRLLVRRPQRVPARAGDEHVHAVDRREPAVEVVVADEVDRRTTGERVPERLLFGAVPVLVVGDDVAAAVGGGEPAGAGVGRDLPAQPLRLDRGARLGRVRDQLPAGLVDVGAVARALAAEAAPARPVRVVALGAALELVVAEHGSVRRASRP